MSDNIAHALSAAGGGMISMAVTYPLNTLSVRLSVKKENNESQLDLLKKMLQKEGVKSLYAGLNSALFGIAITQGIYFYFYEKVKSIYGGASLTVLESMSSGALAGIATAVTTNPIWVINTRQTVSSESFFKTLLDLLKKEGVTSLYKGLVPALILVINPIIQFTVFEQLQERLKRSKKVLSSWDFFFLGAISKLIATAGTYPYILVKSRMQVDQSAGGVKPNTLKTFQTIIKNEGILGLYKGIESKLLQSVLTSAFMFLFKEKLFNVVVALLVFTRLRQTA
ncbi:hypothetical protein HK098_003183 [Nowakowskiella sp. JEL0407]|nr:hypothetical protein HK098_003183 [Nowakowskiella sp. JEL0407]